MQVETPGSAWSLAGEIARPHRTQVTLELFCAFMAGLPCHHLAADAGCGAALVCAAGAANNFVEVRIVIAIPHSAGIVTTAHASSTRSIEPGAGLATGPPAPEDDPILVSSDSIALLLSQGRPAFDAGVADGRITGSNPGGTGASASVR